MTILIITQKVDKNDPVLGFFHEWVLRFSQKATRVFVIANEVGDYNLPSSVEVFSLGKEKKYGKIRRYLKCRKLIKKLSKKSDGIFVHMCPEYAILAWLFSTNKKIFLWYVHKSKNFKLWLAEKMVDNIFTVSKNSCQVKSKKIEIVGHGIDTCYYKKPEKNSKIKDFVIVSVGRISPIKDYKTLIRATCYLVHKKGIRDIQVIIAGDAYLGSDLRYKREIEGLVAKKKLELHVKFLGSTSPNKISRIYGISDLLINLCPTGGMDKVVLEAATCEIPTIVCNHSFKEFVKDYDLIFKHGKPEDLANKIIQIKNLEEEERLRIGKVLRERVVREHGIFSLIEKIIKSY